MAVYRYRVTHTGIAGTPYLSTFYADSASATPSALAAAVATFWTSTASLRISDLVSTGEATVDELDTATGQLIGSTAVTDFQSTASGSGSAAPQAVQILLRLGTQFIVGGRRLEGKIFLPGVRQADIAASGLLTTATRNDYETAAAALRSSLGTGWVVWSRRWSATASVSEAQCWNNFAVLRSRRD